LGACHEISSKHLLNNVTSKKDQAPFAKGNVGEVARSQPTEHLVSSNNLVTNHHADYHKYDADLPLHKLDTFTKGAYVSMKNCFLAVNISGMTKTLINI